MSLKHLPYFYNFSILKSEVSYIACVGLAFPTQHCLLEHMCQ